LPVRANVGQSYYRYHVFFCTNLRADGSACCQRFNAQALRDHAKKRSKALGITGAGGVRINTAGCLDRCAEGPVLVVYPDDVWYSYVDREDIDEIIDEHLLNGRIVERLVI
jgi:(2Fe-2S) ferredoxin